MSLPDSPEPLPILIPRMVLAPYVPTPPDVLERMLDLAGVGSGDVVYDLGCGDGRVVVAAARRGARAVGLDIEAYWVQQGWALAREAGVTDLAGFRQEDALEADVSGATVVFLYLVDWSTDRMLEHLAGQLRPGVRVVSHSFAGTRWPPDRTERFVDASGRERALHLWRDLRPAGPGSTGLR